VLWPIAITFLAGAAAGSLGAMLGIGGAILLIPVLNVALSVPLFPAQGASLVTVVGTSMSVSSASESRRLVNGRLAMVLLMCSVGGALTGVHALTSVISERDAERVFGVTALLISGLMLARIDRRNVITREGVDIGALGGRFFDADTARDVVYRVRRLPVAFGGAFAAGVVSSIAGVGGGIVIVPLLNSLCGVPLRAAAATSSFMIGVTAVPGIIGHYHLGHFTRTELAAAAVLGVLAGTRTGIWLSHRAAVLHLKAIMAVLLLIVGGFYLFFGRAA
jgi:uncharacterized membrane protein YfcA